MIPGATDAGVTVIAPAKINLYLHVLGRRADGYHLLDSLAAFAGIQDVVAARPADDLTLTIAGEHAGDAPVDDTNLVLRAARLLAETAGVAPGAALTLTKRLPVASGMGGGSADAAATLKALDRLWGLGTAPADLMRLGLMLGADVPVCLGGRAAFMGGIGADLAPAPALPPASVLLVNPGVAVQTPAVFRARTGPFSQPGRFDYAPADAGELAALLQARTNDLTEAAIALQPVIETVLTALEACPGVLLARMTGSGATCFGLFADAGDAAAAALALGPANPGWWVKAASLESDAARLDR
ncbi:MAG: 4-(cytidine 5'-diphospho)-2-C-methyl-D-erythritol kinase [Hyphomicrobiales bacterium]|nr:4-(cytidine 5'-diphospho)-2-C-methyl-D-erythritol kinase [Hyphomicrobiales bacterium]MCP5371796.1 4-(cytidine 5'-diphospho)-2-C-methyl-D-erythritol kinase [Hyphomicrobiales bacterium]